MAHVPNPTALVSMPVRPSLRISPPGVCPPDPSCVNYLLLLLKRTPLAVLPIIKRGRKERRETQGAHRGRHSCQVCAAMVEAVADFPFVPKFEIDRTL